jgi:hypothetical protein
LHRRHDRRELPLFLRREIEAPPLHSKKLVDLRRYATLVGSVRTKLAPKRLTKLALLSKECLPTSVVALIHGREPTHLVVRQANAFAQQPRDTLAHATLRRGARVGALSRVRLRGRRRRPQPDEQRNRDEDSPDHSPSSA